MCLQPKYHMQNINLKNLEVLTLASNSPRLNPIKQIKHL
jgi:hypothetical protein